MSYWSIQLLEPELRCESMFSQPTGSLFQFGLMHHQAADPVTKAAKPGKSWGLILPGMTVCQCLRKAVDAHSARADRLPDYFCKVWGRLILRLLLWPARGILHQNWASGPTGRVFFLFIHMIASSEHNIHSEPLFLWLSLFLLLMLILFQ